MLHSVRLKSSQLTRQALFATLVACLMVTASHSLAQQKTAPETTRPAPIDRNGVIILIRAVLVAVHQANITGNYTVLRDLGAPGFRDANSAARLTEIFANLRNQKLDLSGILVLEPQLTVLPEVNAAGFMHMAGFFPSAPLQVNFDLIFAPVAGRWEVFGISVNIGQGGPISPIPSLPSPLPTPAPPPPRAAPPGKK